MLIIILLMWSVTVQSTMDIRRAGWLDRVVEYSKNNFVRDVEKFSPMQINATFIPAPPGYVDSNEWNYDSVIRLLTLIRHSESTKPIQKALRRMLHPNNRRLMMSIKESLNHFPSLAKQEQNPFYYSVEYTDEEEYRMPPQPHVPEDEVVLVVSNPVEARLPSARISVKLLREILVARAIAARVLPSTEKSTIYWKPYSKKPTTKGSAGTDASSSGDSSTASSDATSEAQSTDESTSEDRRRAMTHVTTPKE